MLFLFAPASTTEMALIELFVDDFPAESAFALTLALLTIFVIGVIVSRNRSADDD